MHHAFVHVSALLWLVIFGAIAAVILSALCRSSRETKPSDEIAKLKEEIAALKAAKTPEKRD
jgi:succinate dehydrogenase/fumarate reductase flavoprotein subunit